MNKLYEKKRRLVIYCYVLFFCVLRLRYMSKTLTYLEKYCQINLYRITTVLWHIFNNIHTFYYKFPMFQMMMNQYKN